MIKNDTGNFCVINICLLIIAFLIGSVIAVNITAPVDGSRADSGEENWNLKSASISPENPTSEDIVTYTLVVNDDSEIETVKIYICENNVCGVPKELEHEDTNTYTYKSMSKYTDNSKVSYRFAVTYQNSTTEKIPASSKTENVATVLGSLYFEFYIGEYYNFASKKIEPAAPTETDLVKFTLVVNSDDTVEDVMIEIVVLQPLFTPDLPLKMQKAGDNTYTYTHTKTFEPGSKVGYRFHVKNKDQENYETIPISSSTTDVVEEQGELYFSFDIASGPGDDGGDDDDDDDGGLPGFGAAVAITSLLLIVLVQTWYRKRKD